MAMTAGAAAEDRMRTAMVTGGSGGMGRVIAARLAADGFDVAVAYAGDIDLETLDLSAHISAWCDCLSAAAGLEPPGTRALRPPRRG